MAQVANNTTVNPPVVPQDAEPMEIMKKCEDCPVEAVTVFVDRAEVTRLVTFTPTHLGSHTLTVEGFSSVIDTDSVRVRGTGDFVILEVTHDQRTKLNAPDEPGENDRKGKGEQKERESKKDSQREQDLEAQKEKKKREDEERNTKLQQLKAKIKLAKESMLNNNQAQSRIDTQRYLMDTYSKNVVLPHTSVEKDSKKDNFDVVASVITFQQDKLVRLDEESNKLRLSNEKLAEQITELENEIKALNYIAPQLFKTANDVIIGLDVKKIDKMELRIVYMVSGASWTPSYDVRISTKDNSLSMVYYGNVKQNTKEDWKNTQLTLSTAVPAMNGTPPTLPPKRVMWYSPNYNTPYGGSVASRGSRLLPMPSSAPRMESARNYDENQSEMAEEMSYSIASSSSGGGGGGYGKSIASAIVSSASSALRGGGRRRGSPAGVSSAPVSNDASVATAETAENTTFRIARAATIMSGQKPKKVTVAQLTLESRFVHYTVPAMCEHAYIKATTCNSSDCFLLASTAVSIFLDGNFVSTSQLGNVSPGEEFESYLGVDPAVRIEQKPMSKLHSKRGFLIARQDEEVYSLVTVVKNTKKVPLVIVLKQQLPLSQDQKIKVTALTPNEEELKLGGEAQAKQEELESKGVVHSLHKDHPMIKVERAEAWNCDGCKKPRQAPRYRCSRGCDFDICEDCWTKEIRVGDYAKYDATAGVVEWFKTIAPGKEIQVPYSYSIKWPSGQQIMLR